MNQQHVSAIGRMWSWKITAASAAILLVIALLAISFGPVELAFPKIIRTLLSLPNGFSGQERTLLLDLRLPRGIFTRPSLQLPWLESTQPMRSIEPFCE